MAWHCAFHEQFAVVRVGTAATAKLLSNACNECRRRKARCDKSLPECGPCRRNRRHCLYERHSKTPLTRKHLTEVEEALRRALAQLARAEQRAEQAETRSHQSETINANNKASDDGHTDALLGLALPNLESNINQHEEPGVAEVIPVEVTLEGPPTGPTDFSWDEQSPESAVLRGEGDAATEVSRLSPAEDERVVDGMASLTVDENEAGYLGVASGAAMLRLLLPDAQPQHHAFQKAVDAGPTALDNGHWPQTPLWDTLNLGAVNLDTAISGYFSLYHISYPLVEEHIFRAQYAQVIPRPGGRSWHALAFIIAAIGHFTTSTTPSDIDRRLFMAAKSNISIESLETGNITLVQTLTLMSNYLQKRNKPNSSYNYLGLALHMAIGLGLHKEFRDWDISPLNMEIRRRVWWSIFVFNIGAAVTFGRPLAWPAKNVEVRLPLNVLDRSLTNLSRAFPNEVDHITTFSAVIVQSRFHLLTNDIYTRVISMPFPSAAELVKLDDILMEKWESSVPHWYHRDASIPPRFATSHAIMWWRLSNFKIIMYRPHVIHRVLQARSQDAAQIASIDVQEAHDRCLNEARQSIASISEFWASSAPTTMLAWYALYFLFQASLIPCICLRNEPSSPLSGSWREQLRQTMRTMQLIAPVNPSAQECSLVIDRLCGPFMQPRGASFDAQVATTPEFGMMGHPTEESPQTQINNVYSMMWPNANDAEVDVIMQAGLWTDLFPGIENADQHHTGDLQHMTPGQHTWHSH
ncbi:fungal-specific transcription factor domain-containing protein [Phaeosphaeria sp. MPI-PUGE-AT-0046c]|nr:fungal-specific transcription factor domain-containing protein [Phaeosphaeria sp. MPI-PUGE-AT-0046c]